MKRTGVSAVLGLAVLAALFVATAFAVQEELLDEARKLVAEAKPLVETANNTDLEMDQRKGPRKEAFLKLKHARELFDKYLDANPSKEEALDKEYGDIYTLIFWLKKDSSLGELEKDGAAPDLPQSGGGSEKGAGPADKPGAPPPPDAGSGVKGSGQTPGQPPSDLPEKAKRQFDAITDYEKAHPGDLPLLKQFYEKFLAAFPDPTLPEYTRAVEKLGKINDRMTNVLKTVAKRDPDSLAGNSAGDDGGKAIYRLTQDLNSKDDATRRRAAQLMAESRARAAAFFLARGLADKDEEMARICREGLVAIGGSSVGTNLVKLYRDASKDKQAAALSVLNDVTLKGPVDAAAVVDSIGHFVLSNESDVAESAINLLVKIGKAGGPGLMYGLDSVNPVKKIAAIQALAQVKYYKAATVIGDRFLGSKVPGELRQAALDCMDKMGLYCFPYLIPVISNPWVPVVLNKLAGQPLFIRGDAKKARAWWNANKPKDAED